MFHPVGSQPPSVYWRRRFALLASLIMLLVLVLLTVRVVFSDGSNKTGANGAANTLTPSSPAHSSHTKTKPKPKPRTSTTPATHTTSPRNQPSTSSVSSSSPPPKTCTQASLALAAVTNHPSYTVGDQPVLSIQVTNKGALACVVDLADPQIVLRVYNGESRVWGSHDCEIQPGTKDRTLMAGTTVKVSIIWSGLSSQPKCAGTRERVGAGTYTLYASLAGHEGQAAQFILK
jgi:hypothetical protein